MRRGSFQEKKYFHFLIRVSFFFFFPFFFYQTADFVLWSRSNCYAVSFWVTQEKKVSNFQVRPNDLKYFNTSRVLKLTLCD